MKWNSSPYWPEISMSHGLWDKRALAEVSGQQPGERILHNSRVNSWRLSAEETCKMVIKGQI